MARWEPNARERLYEAALELFEERGYDQTTVGDIAARANLGERTFFRYFGDKREVLSSGTEQLKSLFVAAIASAPKTMTPLDVVVAALEATSTMFGPRRAMARKRMALVAAHAELHERELIKMAMLAQTVSTGLRKRGVARATADLLAAMGMTLFQSAFERWVADAKRRDFAVHVRAALAELKRVTAETGTAKRGQPAVAK